MRLTTDDVLAAYDELDAAFTPAQREAEMLAALRRWDVLKRRLTSQVNRAELRFRQDTASEEARSDAAEAAALSAAAQSRDLAIKQRLLAHPLRPALEQALGAYVFARWETDALAFDPALEADVVREAALYDEFTQTIAGARADFDGEPHTLVSLSRYAEHPDREVRRAAAFAGWEIMEHNAPVLDRVFDDLVRLRAAMADTLGYRSFMELAYKKLGRTDYGAAEVATFRDAIRDDIVPLAAEMAQAQADALGVAAVMPWDEQVFDRLPPFRPTGGARTLTRAVTDGFAAMHPELGAFAELMLERGLFDLEPRAAKAGGAFCTFFPDAGLPFVFAHLNGTTRDVGSTVHEMGHAFQDYSARDKAVVEYILPTAEAGEIHSMAMEYLMWPHYERFVGEDADRYRSQHLRFMLLMLPYIAAIDHFQELVYATPQARPAERNDMWKSVESRYLPFRHDGGIPHLARGGMWQRQRHVYGYPFYYIDYGLAMCCALQFWAASRRDYAAAVETYVALCKRGGEAPFLELVESAGLRSPFRPGALADVAARAREFLSTVPDGIAS